MATFREFMTECEFYEYSQEYFDIMKEATELSMLGTYLENMRFCTEYAPYLEAHGCKMAEGYFCEAVDDNMVEVLQEKFGDGIRNLFGKIYKGILKILDIFINFLSRKKKSFDKARKGTLLDRLKNKVFTKKQIVEMEDWWEANKPKVLKFITIGGAVAGAGTAAVVGGKIAINKNRQKVIDKLNTTEGDTIPEKAMNIANEIGATLGATALPVVQGIDTTVQNVNGVVKNVPLLPPNVKKGVDALSGIINGLTKFLGGGDKSKAEYFDAVTYILNVTNEWKNNKSFDGSMTDDEKQAMTAKLNEYKATLQKIQADLEVKKADVWSSSNETDSKQLKTVTEAIKYANQLTATLMGVMAEYDQLVAAAVGAVEQATKDVADTEAALKIASKTQKMADARVRQLEKNANVSQKKMTDAKKDAADARSNVHKAAAKNASAKENLANKKKEQAEAEEQRKAAQQKFDAGENPDDYKRK